MRQVWTRKTGERVAHVGTLCRMKVSGLGFCGREERDWGGVDNEEASRDMWMG